MMKMDKINIYIPQDTSRMLENDAVQFEIFKKDGRTVNKNRFLTMLLQGYYEEYINTSRQTYEEICSILESSGLSDNRKSDIANEIIEKVFLPKIPVRKGKNPACWSLKPTRDSIGLIHQIEDDLGANNYISQIFCRILMSYCERPFSERERILFKSSYDFIESACKEGATIRFTTIWNQEEVHEVIPYKVVTSREEMYNYLLCGERNKVTGVMEAKSYRLNRVAQLRYGRIREPLDAEVERHLDMMIRYGPQFAINDDEESCVKLTEEGRYLFSRIYFGRPDVERIEKDGEEWLYYFKTSKEQLYQYFKRFEKDCAIVVYPSQLRDRLKKFHKLVFEEYIE